MRFVVEDFLAGYIAGGFGTLVGHPLDTIKTVQQTTNQRISETFFNILKNHNGVRGLFRGLLFPMLSTGILGSIFYGVYGNTLRQLQNCFYSSSEKRIYYVKHVFMAGCVAGFVQTTLACPIELIKIRQQSGRCYTQGSWNCVKFIYKKDGLKGFFRGYTATLLRDVFPCGVYMMAYDRILNWMGHLEQVRKRKEELRTSEVKLQTYKLSLASLAGAAAGVISWVIVIPFDVLKTIIQAEPDISRYTNTMDIITTNLKNHGWYYMFRGSWLLILRAIPVNAATFYSYEYLMETILEPEDHIKSNY